MQSIGLSEKFLSFYEEGIDAQQFLFYIIFSNFHRLAFTFAKERHFSDNPIQFSQHRRGPRVFYVSILFSTNKTISRIRKETLESWRVSWNKVRNLPIIITIVAFR